MKIFLISIHVEKTPPAFPLAAAILKTSLGRDSRTADWNVVMRDYYLPVEAEKIAADVKSSGCDACGFSAYTWNSADIISICEAIRESAPGIRLFAGGPQATADAKAFTRTGLFDFIVRGEGESVLPEALYEEFLSAAQGECSVIDAEAADFAETESPYPAINGTGETGRIAERYDGVLWELSRGCPYNCAFCYESRGCDTIRSIDTDRMRIELEGFRNSGIEKIWVLDPTFNYSSSHAEAVLELVIEIFPEASYTFEIRAELMTEKLCGMLSELNASLQIGLQTTNQTALKNINRSLNRKKFSERCRMMSEYGLTFGIDLIYGLPGDNFRTFRDSLDFAVSAAPNNIDIFPLSILPGTEIAEKTDEYGIIHRGFPSYETVESKSFSRADMKKASALTEAVDFLYNREQAFAWFGTACAAAELAPSEMFCRFGNHRNNDPLDFVKSELRRSGKARLLPVVVSFIKWSRTAEAAFANPGRSYKVQLCRKPEVLDELTEVLPEDFLRRHPAGKERSYDIFFDGEQLYIN